MTTAADVLQMIKDNDCKYVDLRVTDLLGKEMHLTIPADKLDEDTFELGQAFDGSSFAGWRGIESSDMLLQPDPETHGPVPRGEHARAQLRRARTDDGQGL